MSAPAKTGLHRARLRCQRGLLWIYVCIGNGSSVRSERFSMQCPDCGLRSHESNGRYERYKNLPPLWRWSRAALLQPCSSDPNKSNGLIRFTLGSEGDTNALCVPAGGSREPTTAESLNLGRQFLAMDGRTVFKWAVRVVSESSLDILDAAGLTPADVDLVILHQANIRIIDAAAAHFGIPKRKSSLTSINTVIPRPRAFQWHSTTPAARVFLSEATWY